MASMKAQSLLGTTVAFSLALSLAACGGGTTSADQSAADSAAPSVFSSPTPSVVASGAPQTAPPTQGCAAINTIVEQALSSSPEGQTFTADVNVGNDSQKNWLSFVTVLDTQRRSELEQAAAGDDQATQALNALHSYAAAKRGLLSGSIPEFVSDAEAEAAVKEGRDPEINPEYTAANTALVDSHILLSECMPAWPVTF